MALEQRLARAGIVVALGLLVGIGLLTSRSSTEQASAALWVTHTHEVIEALRRVISGVAESESSLRGYAITRDAQHLHDFEPGITLARDGLDTASRLVTGNRQQQRLLHGVQPVLSERVALLRESREAVERGEAPQVPAEALRLSQRIRDLVNEAIENERDLLRERTALSEAQALRTRRNMLLGLVASFLLVVGAFVLFDREMRRRREAQQARVQELSLLINLGELLQTCRAPSEAYRVVERMAPQFFPELSGAISLFQPSRNALEVQARWGDGAAISAVFEPDQCWGLRRGQPHALQGDGQGMICEHFEAPRPRGAVCQPLLANGELLGALHLTHPAAIDTSGGERVAVFGEQVALAIASLQLRETLRNQSIRDPLTALFNRRYTEETLQRELSRAARERSALSLLVLDVDHFKKFNDSYGHETGDEVLKQIALVLRESTRASDIASRLGGEELLIVMPRSGIDDALSKAEQLRAKISGLSIRFLGKPIDPVTVSIGVACFPQHGSRADELTRAADAALYRAKHEGRNRVAAAA